MIVTDSPPASSDYPESGRPLFDRLVADGRLNMVRTFDEPAPHLGRPVDPDRVRGVLLGLAIGDALGNTSESLNPRERRTRYGEIRGYLPNRYAEGRRVRLPSDDTQLAFWTLEHLIENDGRLRPALLAKMFTERQIFGIGRTVEEFRSAIARGVIWHDAAVASAGNGALMRIAPVLTPHLRRAGRDLWVDAALCGAIMHDDRGSIAACVAFVAILSSLLIATTTPSPLWWVDEYVRVAGPIEHDARYRPRGRAFADFEGATAEFVERHLPTALRSGEDAATWCDRWYSGAYLLETVPSALLILARHAGDPEVAIIRAVNDSRDNDTVAAIVGAAIGALHGESAIPARWRDGLLGRTGANDDGKVEALLASAVERFV
jgi:ADP-ribosyl-[dinitrogen reductase] hydrolase